MGAPPEGDYPVAGVYRINVFAARDGRITVVVVRRLWNGTDAMDRRLDRYHFRLNRYEPAARSLRSLLTRVLRELEKGLG